MGETAGASRVPGERTGGAGGPRGEGGNPRGPVGKGRGPPGAPGGKGGSDDGQEGAEGKGAGENRGNRPDLSGEQAYRDETNIYIYIYIDIYIDARVYIVVRTSI